jgi:hypothetical protein
MRRAASVAAALLALALVLAWTGGCVSMKLPAAAPDSVSAPTLALSVGVEADRVEPFSDELVRSLRAAGSFERVDRLDRSRARPIWWRTTWLGGRPPSCSSPLSLAWCRRSTKPTASLTHAPTAPERRRDDTR